MGILDSGIQGKDLGPYRIVAELGSGGMGTVYKAEVKGRVPGLKPGDVVALKIVHPHLLKIPGFFKRFLREGEVGKRIRHPNVVATLDLDGIKIGDETVLYIAMEYVEGQTLWQLFQELGTLPEELGRHLAREVVKGLQAIHEVGAIHRDLKPENILVTKSHQVKVMDLGVARLDDDSSRLSETGTFIGSALYAAPEQFASNGKSIDARADLYALGLMLYELTTGTHPHDADDMPGIMKRVLTETPKRISELNPQVSLFFEELIHTLLAKDREQRIGSAAELLAILIDGEKSVWWKAHARAIRTRTKRPMRRLRLARETSLLGRDAEIARLTALFEKVEARDGRVVLVEGEAGIGKSRLVDEFVAGLAAKGKDVNFLFGGFPPGGAATSSGAFAAACLEFFGEGDLEGAVREHLPETPILVPAFAALLRGDTSPTGAEPLTPDSVQTVFVHLLRSLAAERPTILLIDDLHLAPQQGLALFAALALIVPGHRLMILATARPGLPDEWTANLVRASHTHRLEVPRLGIKDLARLLIAAVGSERLADEIGFQIVLKSDGNPFFILEILRSLRESNVLAQNVEGAWYATRVIRDIAIPASIQELVKSRIAGLTDEERDLLEVAACSGFEFDPRLVSDATGIDRVTVLKRLAKVERLHRIVHPLGDRFVFDHHELHQALYAGLSDSLRCEYHASLAAALERREGVAGVAPEKLGGARAVELASLLLDAGSGDRALRYLTPALDHLDRTYASDTAADLATRALAASGAVTGTARIELLVQQAGRLSILGRHDAERDVVQEATQLATANGDPRLRARALVALARNCRHVARYEEVLPRLDEALALAAQCGSKDAEADARGILGDILCELGRYDEARSHHQRELELWRELGDPNGEATATGKLGNVHYVLGRYDEAYSHFLRDLGLSRKTRCRLGKANVKQRLGTVLFALGRYDDALIHFSRCLSLSRLIGFRRGEALALAHLGEVHMALGDLDTGRRELQSSLSLCRETGIRYVHGQALHALSLLETAAGDARAAFGHTKAALNLRKEIGDRAGVAASLVLLGRLRRAAGATDAATAAFVEARDLAVTLDLAGECVLAAAHLAQLDGGTADDAEAALERYQDRMKVSDRMEARWLLWQTTGNPEHLAEAKHLLEHVLDHVAPESRELASARSPLLHQIAAA